MNVQRNVSKAVFLLKCVSVQLMSFISRTDPNQVFTGTNDANDANETPPLLPKSYKKMDDMYANVPKVCDKQVDETFDESQGDKLQFQTQKLYPAPVGPLNPPKILPSTINQQYTTVHATDRIAALHDPLKQQQQQRQQQHQQHKQHEIVQQPGQQNIQIHYFDRATQNKHQQFFLSKLNVARYTGIVQTTLGALSILIGIIMPLTAPRYFNSNAGSGIWTGIFTVISGALSIASSFVPNRFGTRCAALTFCIFAMLMSLVAALMNIIPFDSNPSCEKTCRPKSTYHYDYDELECTEICRKDRGGGSYFSLLLFFIVVGVFVTSLVNAVIMARGCCNCCRCCECSESRRQGPDQVFRDDESTIPIVRHVHQQHSTSEQYPQHATPPLLASATTQKHHHQQQRHHRQQIHQSSPASSIQMQPVVPAA